MDSEYVDRLVNLICRQFGNDATIRQIVAIEGLIKHVFHEEYHIETVPSELYNPQDPMFTVMHESVINIGQISFWENNQLLIEVLGFNGDQLLMRQLIISSTEEIERVVYEYFAKLRS